MQVSIEIEETIQLLSHRKSSFLPLTLGKFPQMKSLIKSSEKYYLLSHYNQLFIYQSDSISRITLPIKIAGISGNNKTILLLGDIGVYYIGNDLLSANIVYTANVIEGLEQVKFLQASIGLVHASGIDELGNLYIWGGPHGSPHLIESSKVFTTAKVVCGNTITCVCTGGGYLYLFGGFNSHDIDNIPYTLSELEKYFVVDACIGDNFCGVLTEDGSVLDLIKEKNYIKCLRLLLLKAFIVLALALLELLKNESINDMEM